jgi:hypothetical protein
MRKRRKKSEVEVSNAGETKAEMNKTYHTPFFVMGTDYVDSNRNHVCTIKIVGMPELCMVDREMACTSHNRIVDLSSAFQV